VASNVTRRRFPPAAASRPEAPGGPLRSIRSRFTAAAAAHLQDPRPVKVGARYWPVQLQGDAAQDLHPRIQDALLEWTANSSFVRQGMPHAWFPITGIAFLALSIFYSSVILAYSAL